MQVRSEYWLRDRMLQNLARIVSTDLLVGENYDSLSQTISIWLLDHEFLIAGHWAEMYQLQGQRSGETLSDKAIILVLDLPQWRKFNWPGLPRQRSWDTFKSEDDRTKTDNWLAFLSAADTLDTNHLPALFTDGELEEAVNTMITFVSKEHEQHYNWAVEEAARIKQIKQTITVQTR